mmetsp:Transcript_34740/g.87927  ORF Transcript_34740/g.87927 Transcript_34740/m.87927 type:complete len:105 (-) Transcript_34740:260-574(-)|eukprot:CAMPEP_0202863698 /NCGR_PEP_ID=MMETSP1391-20130828/4222_1 /ASSEMBLY_ACC=CAM_ASM_000867 /TAXON_ID=1034604 /ORGANISM="Chlamydomonas leiostraca, Strain SAG 11-49" /LENGTH=104 /DNA_ID=CAMNT_0049543357 /DNA_START=57 /DNA_END=371 /DNA_ORIENTATION=-
MAAVACNVRSLTVAPRVARKATAGVVRPVARKMVVRASAQKQAALTAGVVSAVGAAMANPLVAEAAVTPSLKNFLLSLVAGGTVLAAIAGAVTAVSNFDPVKRG